MSGACPAGLCVPTSTTIAALRAAPDGEFVPALTVEAVFVTYVRPAATGSNGFYIQAEATGPAIFVYTASTAASTLVSQGDLINLTVSKLSSFYNIKQVEYALDPLVVVSGDHSISSLIQDFSTGGTIDEATESEIIRINGATLTSGFSSTWNMAYNGGANSTKIYYNGFFEMAACEGMTFDLLGIAGEYAGQYQIRAWRDSDFSSVDTTQCVAPDDSNWDFESTTSWDPPSGFTPSASPSFAVTDETSQVNKGSHSAKATWTTTSTMRLFARWLPQFAPDSTYKLHAWAYDKDPCGRVRTAIAEFDGSGAQVGSSTYSPYTTDVDGWVELVATITNSNSSTDHVASLSVAFNDDTGAASSCTQDPFSQAEAILDDLAFTQAVTFDSSDGALDDALPGKPTTPPLVAGVEGSTMTIFSAINNDGLLYVSVDKAAFGSDHILYIWVGAPDASMAYPPWNKSGSVQAPATGTRLFALAQEEANGYCSWQWWNDLASDWDTTGLNASSSACSGAAGTVLEGHIDLTSILGLSATTELPAWIGFAVAPYQTDDSGSLISSSQIPGSMDFDPNIDDTEIQMVHRADLLVGKVTE
ncbi:MAG: hypothetical protein JRH20_31375 [Deltaproteobacteria bacterium]|nr:hypothetical protein [Deltaproteobacteria bacterium]